MPHFIVRITKGRKPQSQLPAATVAVHCCRRIADAQGWYTEDTQSLRNMATGGRSKPRQFSSGSDFSERMLGFRVRRLFLEYACIYTSSTFSPVQSMNTSLLMHKPFRVQILSWRCLSLRDHHPYENGHDARGGMGRSNAESQGPG